MKKPIVLMLAFASLLPAGLQASAKPVPPAAPASVGTSGFDYAVDAVERAYAGYTDKTAGRETEYAALKERLQIEIASGRDPYDAVAEYIGWFDDYHLDAPGAGPYRPKAKRRDTDYTGRMKRYDPQFVRCRVDKGCGIDAEGIAPDVRIPLPLPDNLTDNIDTWVRWAAEELKTNTGK